MVLLTLIVLSILFFIKLFNEFGKEKTILNNKAVIKIIQEKTQLQPKSIKLQQTTVKNDSELKEFEKLFLDIYSAFTQPDLDFLKEHVSDVIYEKFCAQILKRQSAELTQKIEIVFKDTTIQKKQKYKTKEKIWISFKVSQMSIIINNEGKILDNPNKIFIDLCYKWTLAREDDNHKWKLVKNTVSEC